MDVFISYARPNEAQSLLVAQALRSRGFNVWRDDELPAHRAYAEVIEERLKSAKAVVVLWSADAARSQWVRAEADTARNAGTLVQASLDGTLPPLPFNQIQSADLRGWTGQSDANGWRKLLASVAALTGAAEPDAAAPARVALPAPRKMWPPIAALVLLAGALGTLGIRHLQDTEPKRLAVLPFQASNGADGDVADGLSEELISQLSQNRELRVIGRASAWQYKGKAVDLRTVGRQLGADYLVDGNVARDGNGMRVAVSLVRASDGTTMWSHVYTASNQQTPTIRAAIGAGLVDALGVPQASDGRGYKPNGDAYALYLKGRALFRQRTSSSMEGARTLMIGAISLDPKFAAPYAYAGGITALLGEKSFQLDPAHPDGPSMTPTEAVEHALKLDPNLPDAQGFMGWVGGPWSVEAVGHLQRAVELSPNNSQILFWWTQSLLRQGNYARYADVATKAAALDPLWPKVVTEAASASLWAGDRAAVQRYLQRIKAGNPAGAIEVESNLAAQQGDLSRVVELGLSDKSRPYQQSTEFAALALINLGFEREGRLIGHFGPQDVLFNSDSVPDRATLLKLVNEDPETFDYGSALYQLRTHGRYGDVAALYDARKGDLFEIRRATFANREVRMTLGGVVAQALMKVGRKVEAAQMLRLTDDADQAILGYGRVAPYDLITIAGNDAVGGHREEAIQLLQQATAKGFYMGVSGKGEIDPVWENLRGDPRFERIARLSVAKVQQERREVLALNVL